MCERQKIGPGEGAETAVKTEKATAGWGNSSKFKTSWKVNAT